MAARCFHLIGCLVLSLSILLCPAAPLDEADKDENESKRARLTGISPFDLIGKREDGDVMKRARLTGISPFDLIGKRDSNDAFLKRARLTGISPFDLIGKRDTEDAVKRAKLTGISPFDLIGKRAEEWAEPEADKRARLTGISPFDLFGKRPEGVFTRLPSLPLFDLPVQGKLSRVADAESAE